MNREQRRAAERAARKATQKGQMTPDVAQQMLVETVQVNRWDSVNRVIGMLFDQDPGGGLFRLKGLGGPTGVVTAQAVEEAAQGAITAGMLLPQVGPAPDDEAPTDPEAAATEGGVVLQMEDIEDPYTRETPEDLTAPLDEDEPGDYV